VVNPGAPYDDTAKPCRNCFYFDSFVQDGLGAFCSLETLVVGQMLVTGHLKLVNR